MLLLASQQQQSVKSGDIDREDELDKVAEEESESVVVVEEGGAERTTTAGVGTSRSINQNDEQVEKQAEKQAAAAAGATTATKEGSDVPLSIMLKSMITILTKRGEKFLAHYSR